MKEPKPDGLDPVDPKDRFYPASWRDAAIRILFDEERDGLVCKGCQRLFRGRAELRTLHADHIVAWGRGGRTTWENLQILCRSCNLLKWE
jgi:5-methylcytosine-specific restriction endonuclease McrA